MTPVKRMTQLTTKLGGQAIGSAAQPFSERPGSGIPFSSTGTYSGPVPHHQCLFNQTFLEQQFAKLDGSFQAPEAAQPNPEQGSSRPGRLGNGYVRELSGKSGFEPVGVGPSAKSTHLNLKGPPAAAGCLPQCGRTLRDPNSWSRIRHPGRRLANRLIHNQELHSSRPRRACNPPGRSRAARTPRGRPP